jgi:hypothetical protein
MFTLMKTPPLGRPKGRPPKRQRTQDELADLARRLGADWQPGDNVMTWIRRHEAADTELSRLVRDGWSWTDVGLALALAGIKYQTGRAIPGYLLQRKAQKARADERRRRAGEALCLPSAVTAAEAPVSINPPMKAAYIPHRTASSIPTESAMEDKEPEFRPASLKGWSGTKIVKGERKPAEETAPDGKVSEGDAEEVIAKLFGRK